MIDRDLTGRETLIMKCIWSAGKEISLQEVQKDLKEMYDWDAKRSTVRTFLTSIEGKGFITIERRGRYSYIKPLINEEKYKRDQAEKMVDFWYEGSTEGLIKTLINGKLSEEDERYLMEVLGDLDEC